MNVNVSKVSNEEEILLWYEKFPDFVKFLKLIIVNSGHFEIFYENNKSCKFESKSKYKSFWDGKWYDNSFIDIEIGDTYQQRFHENRISTDVSQSPFSEYELLSSAHIDCFPRQLTPLLCALSQVDHQSPENPDQD